MNTKVIAFRPDAATARSLSHIKRLRRRSTPSRSARGCPDARARHRDGAHRGCCRAAGDRNVAIVEEFEAVGDAERQPRRGLDCRPQAPGPPGGAIKRAALRHRPRLKDLRDRGTRHDHRGSDLIRKRRPERRVGIQDPGRFIHERPRWEARAGLCAVDCIRSVSKRRFSRGPVHSCRQPR